MQDKSRYTLQELFDNLPISLRQLGIKARVSEVTVASIRDGGVAQRAIINRLLGAMSQPDVYDRPLSLANVIGVNIRGGIRPTDAGGRDITEKPSDEEVFWPIAS